MSSTSTSIPQRKVLFLNFDPVVESQKAERRFKKVVEKRKMKEAKKMARMERNEDIKYYLSFLSMALDRAELREKIHSNGIAFLTRELFPDLNEQEGIEVFFDDVVDNLKLPAAPKKIREVQEAKLQELMVAWSFIGWYDSELDRFLQFLRLTGKGRLSVLPEFLASLVGDDTANQEASRDLALRLDESVGRHPARSLSDEAIAALRSFMDIMVKARSYSYGSFASLANSSDESSDGDSVLEETHF